MKACPSGNFKQVVSYQNTAGPFTVFSGRVVCDRRLEKIIGMTVKSVLLKCDGSLALSSGFIFKLGSSVLGSRLVKNNFAFASSLNTSDCIMREHSDTLSIHSYSNVTGNARSNLDNANEFMPFIGPTSIDGFDWRIEPVNGALTFPSAYTIEIVLEFVPLCLCSNGSSYI